MSPSIFQVWKLKHNKKYGKHIKTEVMGTEERHRFKVWMANKAMIEIHNQKFEMVSYE